MKQISLFTFLFISLLSSLSAQNSNWQDKTAPDVLASVTHGKTSDVLVVMREHADVRAAEQLATKLEKARFVFERLQSTAEQSQVNARAIIRAAGAKANSLFLVNAIGIEQADRDLVSRLAALPEVAWIGSDPWVKFENPFVTNTISAAPKDRSSVEWGIEKIRATAVWDLGYTGQGITVGGADTGYEWTHPAIQPKYRGWNGAPDNAEHNYNWHDAIHDYSPLNLDSAGNPGFAPCGLNGLIPCDDNNHGTHTMGTMTGDDGQGNQIGVAPGARWVGCRNMERGWGRPSTYIECFEWFMAPTDLNNQNPDPAKAPHVINNSWYCAYEEGCTDSLINDLIRIAVANLKASGVVVVISNGNDGPWCGTTSHPAAMFQESFSIGATQDNDYIAGFSSRGPVLVDGSNRMKPNVSAPGQNVRSSIRNGEYANFSGTSMAGPHVVGLVALVLSARPELAGHVADIEQIIEQTSIYFADTVDCGPGSLGISRPNHAFGWGRVDALDAVNQALLWQPPVSTHSPNLLAASVFPNPVSETAVFDVQNCLGKTSLEVFAMDGKRVIFNEIQKNGHMVFQTPVTGLNKGMYVYKISSENGVLAGKLVVESR
jgi:serine protease AprX